jgi:hypothetical protein
MNPPHRRQSRLVRVGVLCEVCRAARASLFRTAPLCAACAAADAGAPAVPLAPTNPSLAFCSACDAAPATTYCVPAAAALCAGCDARVHVHTASDSAAMEWMHTPIQTALASTNVSLDRSVVVGSGKAEPRPLQRPQRGSHQLQQRAPIADGQCFLQKRRQIIERQNQQAAAAMAQVSTIAAAAAAAAAGEMYLLSAASERADKSHLPHNVVTAASAAASATLASRTHAVPPLPGPAAPLPPLPSSPTCSYPYLGAEARIGEVGYAGRPPMMRAAAATASATVNAVEMKAALDNPSASYQWRDSLSSGQGSAGALPSEETKQRPSTGLMRGAQCRDRHMSAVIPSGGSSGSGDDIGMSTCGDDDQGVPDFDPFESLDLSMFSD